MSGTETDKHVAPPPLNEASVRLLVMAGVLQVAMKSGRWWSMRPNGKGDTKGIRIPYKAGLRVTGQITETDFIDGVLDPRYFRIDPDKAAYAWKALGVVPE